MSSDIGFYIILILTMSDSNSPPKKTPNPLSNLGTALKVTSFIICTMYAGFEHDTNPKHPFFSALGTAIRMVAYVTGGRFIGDLFPITGDLCVIGSIGLATCKTFFLENSA
jgi:hypothetical protein